MHLLNTETFEFEGDPYFQLKYHTQGLPLIAGNPPLVTANYAPVYKYTLKDSYGRRIKYPTYISTPKNCKLQKMIHWNWKDFGGLMQVVIGNFGTGKSVLVTTLAAYLAATGIKIIIFDNMHNEARHLSHSGYFKDKTFQPFSISYCIPKNANCEYQNELWNRQNVTLNNYNSMNDIYNAIQQNHITVVYDECFDETNKLKLWIALMKMLKRNFKRTNRYMFVHHELAQLFPENPTKETYKLIQNAAKVAMDLRKNNIGLLTTYHIPSEVFFRISQKFGYIIYKKPANRRSMSPPELSAKKYNVQQFNVSVGGYWRKYTIGAFPSLVDNYRIISNEILSYPALQPIQEETEEEDNEFLQLMHDPINVKIWTLRQKGTSYREIAKERDIPLTFTSILERFKKMEAVYSENY